MSGLLVSIQREVDALPPTQISRKKCIYRVSKMLRRENGDAFTPILVSIGPLHHKNEGLLLMETHKLKYLRSLINNSEANLKSYLGVIKDKEREIRECYAEPIDMSSDDLVRMVLIDSAFIIEVFRSHVIKLPLTYREVIHDLQLAENQLPFFILKDLYWAAFNSTTRPSTTSFTHMACRWFLIDKDKIKVDPSSKEAEGCCHLIDLLRSQHLPLRLSLQQSDTNVDNNVVDVDSKSIFIPTATSLHEAGVKFRVAEDSLNLLEIHFNKERGILTIPKLLVHDDTGLLFRNLIAFEQWHYSPHNYLTDYLFFMDCLIDTKEDVHLLAEAGIIHNWIGSEEEVACLVNSLNTHSFTSRHFYYTDISKQLNQHCKKRWNSYRATLMHTYFKHPWAMISVIYAVVLLILTILQVASGFLALSPQS